jgi:allantoinase
MGDFDLLITGRVVRPDTVIDNGFVAVRSGRVERVGVGVPPQARARR